MITVSPFIPNVKALEWLIKKFQKHNEEWGLIIPTNPIEFTILVAGSTSKPFVIGEQGEEPQGMLLFTDVVPGDCASAHIMFWAKGNSTTKDRAIVIRRAIVAMMQVYDLYRITGLTHQLAARKLAEMVGFTVEGLLRSAIKLGDKRYDGWVTSIIREDLEKILGTPGVVE